MNSYYLIIYVVAFVAIFYFMAIRPQQKQRKAHQALLSSLKKGDRIVTTSGIYGTVKRIEDSAGVVVVEVAKGVTMKIARRAVGEIITDDTVARMVAPEGSSAPRGKRGSAPVDDSPEESGTEETEEDPWNKDIWKKDQ